jgi:hypothetical protein
MDKYPYEERDRATEAILHDVLAEEYTFKQEGGWKIYFRGRQVALLASNLTWLMPFGPVHPKFREIVTAVEKRFGIQTKISEDIEYKESFEYTEDRTKALNVLLKNLGLRAVKTDYGWAVRKKNSGPLGFISDLFDRSNVGVIGNDLRTIHSMTAGRTLWEIVAQELQAKYGTKVRIAVSKHL